MHPHRLKIPTDLAVAHSLSSGLTLTMVGTNKPPEALASTGLSSHDGVEQPTEGHGPGRGMV